MLNEIFARHGYHFDRGGKFDRYFRSTSWYRENQRYASNQQIYDRELSGIEWANESLVKKVREDMIELETTNEIGLSLNDVLYGRKPYQIAFDEGDYFYGGQKLDVYNGPGRQYERAGDGKARMNTDERMWVAGIEKDYVLVMYKTRTGYRSGYVALDDLQYDFLARVLDFPYLYKRVNGNCTLFADPYGTMALGTIFDGTWVTWLANCGNQAYIEAKMNGKTVRGFVQSWQVSD